jgi:hypothetical protein
LHNTKVMTTDEADAQRNTIVEVLQKRASVETEARYIVRMAAAHALAQAPR